MTDTEQCSNCAQANDCKTVYEQLGKAAGPSVAGKAIAVFLAPIGIFIVCLVFLDKKLVFSPDIELFRILPITALAALASLVYVLIVRKIIGRSVVNCKDYDDRNQG